jgi:hypothetical protein
MTNGNEAGTSRWSPEVGAYNDSPAIAQRVTEREAKLEAKGAASREAWAALTPAEQEAAMAEQDAARDAEADAEPEPDSIFGIDLDEPVEYWTEIHLEAEAEAHEADRIAELRGLIADDLEADRIYQENAARAGISWSPGARPGREAWQAELAELTRRAEASEPEPEIG